MKKKRALVGLLTTGLLMVSLLSGCGGTGSGAADAKKGDPKYPVKPIDYIVPNAAGGGTDICARAIAEYVSKEWGQPVNVINKPGAGGATGTQEVLKQAKNDGYTVLAANMSNASTLIASSTNLPYKFEDFSLIAQVVQDPLCFVVKEDAPWKDLRELSEWAKANPDQLTYTTSGATAISTYAVAEWLDAIGGDFSKARMVVTTGAADSIPKVAGGHVILAVQSVGESANMVKAGKVKMIAVQSDKRSQYFPDVPTVEESGIKMKAMWWTGVAGRAGTPDYVIKKWEETLAKAAEDPAFIDKLKKINAESAYLNSEDFTNMAKSEVERYTKMANEKGLRK